MPTFDGGHCFLTTLIPINSENVVDLDGLHYSHVQLVRNALAVLPTAHQSPATVRQPCNSPFARCTKTHFARLVVLDNTIFNGRMPENSLLVAIKALVGIKGGDPTVPKPVDTLPTPYLFFIADVDAGTEAELRDWLRGVWTKMRADLDPVFVHCFQYADDVKDADSFADYMIAHQLETTMPFNDYWPGGVDLTKALPTLSLPGVAAVAIVVAGAVGWGLSWLFGWLGLIPEGRFWYALEMTLFGVVGLGAALYAAYKMVIRAGLKPFPMAPNSDLLSVLKGLHLQRQLIGLVPTLQGGSDQVVFEQMGAFLNAARLDDLLGPTQAPGTIGK